MSIKKMFTGAREIIEGLKHVFYMRLIQVQSLALHMVHQARSEQRAKTKF